MATIDLLACPVCGGGLSDSADAGGTERLVCRRCGRAYPVVNGVPRLVPPNLAPELSRTADAFGWQWRHFVEMVDLYEAQFLDWVNPLVPSDFASKDVLDAGCGIGRHAYFAARYGARSVTALDLSLAVETARETLSGLDNVRVVQGDLIHPPFKSPEDGGGFDLVYSIGVLHHLPDPRAGFLSLVRQLRPGGTVAVWVYGHENNGFVRHVIEPLRRGTTKIPPPLLRTVAWPLAVWFHAVVKGVYRPARGTMLGRHLPLSDYLSSLSDFQFRQNYNIVFDQLVAPTAAYLRREDLAEWCEAAGLESVRISHRHGNSWRVAGRAPARSS